MVEANHKIECCEQSDHLHEMSVVVKGEAYKHTRVIIDVFKSLQNLLPEGQNSFFKIRTSA